MQPNFDDVGTQNYLVFQPVYKCFEINSGKITSKESKGLSNEKISFSTGLINTQPPIPAYDNARIKVKFNGDFLKLDNVTYNHRPIVNIYVVYRIAPTTIDASNTLQNCLFGSVKLTKNADIDKYKYSGSSIEFDSRGRFSHPGGGYGRNVIISRADLSSSSHANNKTRSILVLGKDFIQGIDGTTIYVKKMYSTNFTAGNKTFCLSLHYDGDNSLLFVNGTEIINFKAKDSEIVPYPLCLGNISKDFTVPYILKTGFTGYIYDFSVDYWAIANDKILVIHKYLMKKNNTV